MLIIVFDYNENYLYPVPKPLLEMNTFNVKTREQLMVKKYWYRFL